MRKSGSHQRLAQPSSNDEETPAAQQRTTWVRSGTPPCLDNHLGPRLQPQSIGVGSSGGCTLMFAALAALRVGYSPPGAIVGPTKPRDPLNSAHRLDRRLACRAVTEQAAAAPPGDGGCRCDSRGARHSQSCSRPWWPSSWYSTQPAAVSSSATASQPAWNCSSPAQRRRMTTFETCTASAAVRGGS